MKQIINITVLYKFFKSVSETRDGSSEGQLFDLNFTPICHQSNTLFSQSVKKLQHIVR